MVLGRLFTCHESSLAVDTIMYGIVRIANREDPDQIDSSEAV